jgi:hypothetical protein
MGTACTALGKKYAALERKEATAAERDQAQQAAADEANRKRESVLFVACATSCNRARTADQRQEDNERAANCSEKCGDDAVCLSSCGGGSATACQARCLEKYPSAASTP